MFHCVFVCHEKDLIRGEVIGAYHTAWGSRVGTCPCLHHMFHDHERSL